MFPSLYFLLGAILSKLYKIPGICVLILLLMEIALAGLWLWGSLNRAVLVVVSPRARGQGRGGLVYCGAQSCRRAAAPRAAAPCAPAAARARPGYVASRQVS